MASWEEFLSQAAQSMGDNLMKIADGVGNLLGAAVNKLTGGGPGETTTFDTGATGFGAGLGSAFSSPPLNGDGPTIAPLRSVSKIMGEMYDCVVDLPQSARDSIEKAGSVLGNSAIGAEVTASAQDVSRADLGGFAPAVTPSLGQGRGVGGPAIG